MTARLIGLATLVLATSLAAAVPGRAEDLVWNTELGFLTSYYDNYFYRSDDGPTPDETFLTVYGQGEIELDVGPGDLKLFAGGSGAFARDIEAADYQTANAGIQFKRGRTRAGFAYARTNNRVFSEEAVPSLFDTNSYEFKVRHRLFDPLSVQGAFEIDDWEFDASEPGRDALSYELDGGLRWTLREWITLRGSFLWLFKNAEDPRYDWEGPGFTVGADLRPGRSVDLALRYRRRWRDYEEAPAGDSNFERSDVIDDVRAKLRWRATRIFGFQLEGSYRHGDSTRVDRNYDAASVTGGIFVTFGNEER